MNGCICSLLLALAAGGGILADELIFTDPTTGFSTAGSVWLRYGALVLVSLAFLLLTRPGKPVPENRISRSRVLAGMFAAQALAFLGGCVMALVQILSRISAAGGLFDRYTGRMNLDVIQLLIAVGWFIGGLWCGCTALAFAKGEQQPAGALSLGILTTVSFFFLCARRFVNTPTSIQRVMPTLDLMSALAAMLLCCALLRWLYLPVEECQPRRLCFFGLEAFLFDFCIVGAKQAAHLSLGEPLLEEIGDLPLLFIGLLGAAVTLQTIRSNPPARPAHFREK